MEGGVVCVVNTRDGRCRRNGSVAKRRNNNNSDQRVASARLDVRRRRHVEQTCPDTVGLMAPQGQRFKAIDRVVRRESKQTRGASRVVSVR